MQKDLSAAHKLAAEHSLVVPLIEVALDQTHGVFISFGTTGCTLRVSETMMNIVYETGSSTPVGGQHGYAGPK
jgi:hypothetical protein